MANIMTMSGVLELIERTEPQIPVLVNLAYQPDLEREVVIKRLTPAAASDPQLRRRFAKEARVLASMHHHNIVQVYDACLQDELPYVVMEQLSGITVQQRLDFLLGQHQRLEIDEIAQIVGSVASAVEYAHQLGVLVHDLSLNNIVITSDGRTVLAGLSRPLPENLLTATPAELAFSAPERLFGGHLDARSDVYALGVLLYTLVAGRLPFAGAAGGILGQKQAAATLPPLDDPRSELPCAYTLVHVMRQATAYKPGMRYATVAAFREAFVGALNGQAKLKLVQRISYDMQRRAQLRRHARHATGRAALQLHQQVSATVHASVTRGSVEPVIALDDENRQLTQTVTEPLSDIPLCRPVASGPDCTVIAPFEGAAPPASEQVGCADEIVASAVQVALVPGSDRPELQIALPYTVLVPIAESTMPDVTPKAPIEFSVGSVLTVNLWLVAMFALGAIAVGAAIAVG